MATFSYLCRLCGRRHEAVAAIGHPPNVKCACGAHMSRDYKADAPKIGSRGFETHFNKSTGTVVSNKREFADELKRKSDHMTEYTGIPHDLKPYDGDAQGAGVNMDHLKEIHRQQELARG